MHGIAFPFQKIIEIMIVLGQKMQEISKTRIYPVVNPYFGGPPQKKTDFAQPVFIP